MATRKFDDQQRAVLLDQLFRRIGQFDDDRLIDLVAAIRNGDGLRARLQSSGQPENPSLVDTQVASPTLPNRRRGTVSTPPPFAPPGGPPSNDGGKGSPRRIGRRAFLLGLLLGGGTAVVATGTILTVNNLNNRPVPLPTNSPTPLPTATEILAPSATPGFPIEAVNQLDRLQQQITQLTSERDQLRGKVDSLTTQVNELDTQINTLNSQRDDLTKQLTDANARITNLTATVDQLAKDNTAFSKEIAGARQQNATLKTRLDNTQSILDSYSQLDQLNIDSFLTDAETALNGSFATLDNSQQPVTDGLKIGDKALQDVDTQMVEIAAGIDWLDKQVAVLTASFRAYQTAMQMPATVDPGEASQNFITQVLNYLPFTASQDMRLTLQAIGVLLGHLPTFLNSVNTLTIIPARLWIVPSTDKQNGLYKLLLNPIRDQVLTPTQQLLNNAENLKMIYNTKLAQPSLQLLDQRRKLQAEIVKKIGALNGQ